MASFGMQLVRFAASMGVSVVVSNAVKMNTPANINTLNRVLVVIGETVLSAMISDKSADYVEKVIDDIGTSMQAAKKI